MVYVDTSALVALLTVEPETARVRQWFETNTEPLVSADWCAVEFASALAAKRRAGQLRLPQVRRAQAAFDELVSGGLQLLPLARATFHRAAELCGTAKSALRAGDALHLAAALEAGARSLAGLDVTMNKAAKELGLSVQP